MKTNVTLKLDADLLREARVVAAEEGRSISALLTDRLEAIVRERKAFDKARRRALAACVRASTSSGRLPSPATNSMSDRYFVDTNILMYAHDTSAGEKHERARALVEELWRDRSGLSALRCFRSWRQSAHARPVGRSTRRRPATSSPTT